MNGSKYPYYCRPCGKMIRNRQKMYQHKKECIASDDNRLSTSETIASDIRFDEAQLALSCLEAEFNAMYIERFGHSHKHYRQHDNTMVNTSHLRFSMPHFS